MLQQKIKEEIKEAMKAKDQVKLGVVRGLVAGFTNELVTLKRMPDGELTDEEVLNVIRRAVKQRKDSIDQFSKGGRTDLAETEQAELSVLEKYLPAQMSEADLTSLVEKVITENNFAAKDFGSAMGKLKAQAGDKADGATLAKLLKEKLK